MTVFVLATHNAHKVDELRRILGEQLGPHRLVGYDGPEPVEDGDSFEANALIKARAAAVFTGLPAIADDSGICVDALGGAPGIHSARYAGTRDDADNYRLLLANLEGVADRRAQFVCAAALVLPSGGEHVTEGVLDGWLTGEPRGSNGFGYDPIFVPSGGVLTTAQLSPAEKDQISHRGKALRALAPVIAALLGN